MEGQETQFAYIENALRGLDRLIKAVRFYPPGHPALKATLNNALAAFSQTLHDGDVTFVVRKQGFFVEGELVAAENRVLQDMATSFFARRLQQILFQRDLSPRDLMVFAHALVLDIPTAQRQGGVTGLLSQGHVTTIWVNDLNLELIQKQREERERAKEAAEETEEDLAEELMRQWQQTGAEEQSHEDRTLARVVEELRQTNSDQRFQLLRNELLPLIHINLTEEDYPSILQAFAIFTHKASTDSPHYKQRQWSREALNELGTVEILDYPIDALCHEDLEQTLRESALNAIIYYQERVVAPLMRRLTGEMNPKTRWYLTQALVQQDVGAIPLVSPYLKDERWPVVRNALYILGELRSPAVLIYFTPLLGHPEPRVRREALRAITKVGGKTSVGILVRVLEGKDEALRQQAIMSLGALKDPAGIPILLKILSGTDPLGRKVEDKLVAVKALGKMGSPEALAPLCSLLGRRRWLRRTRHDQLRAAAASALGELGSARALSALEAACDDHSPDVERAAFQALNLIQRQKQ